MASIARHKKVMKIVRDHPLVGTWTHPDTGIVYTVSRRDGRFAVTAVDRSDGEVCEISEVKWDGEALSFTSHVPSTDWTAYICMQVQTKTAVQLTITFNELWHRDADSKDPS